MADHGSPADPRVSKSKGIALWLEVLRHKVQQKKSVNEYAKMAVTQ